MPLCPQEDAERVLELAHELGSALGPLDEDVVRAFASVSAGELCPVASFMGALAAQEAMKVSGDVVGSAVPKRSVATRGHLLSSWGLRALGAERRVG